MSLRYLQHPAAAADDQMLAAISTDGLTIYELEPIGAARLAGRSTCSLSMPVGPTRR